MKKILILGSGCYRCNRLHQHAMAAVAELRIECEVEKVEDINEIVEYGVLNVPALIIDGEVKSQGKVLSIEEIKNLLEE